jgi:hypothetical protein
VNRGTLRGNIPIPAYGINEMLAFDFAADPVGGAGSATTPGTDTLTPTETTATTKSYTATVILPIAVAQSFEVAGPTGPILIPITAIGNAKLVGPVTIDVTREDPYIAWTESNGIPGAPFTDDENGDGVQNGLQWSLGLAAGDSPLPFLLQPVGDMGATVDFSVTLPGGGSAADITVIASDDPESTPFVPLASGSVSSGNPIPAGTTGIVTISLPKETQGFVQLSVRAPAP